MVSVLITIAISLFFNALGRSSNPLVQRQGQVAKIWPTWHVERQMIPKWQILGISGQACWSCSSGSSIEWIFPLTLPDTPRNQFRPRPFMCKPLLYIALAHLYMLMHFGFGFCMLRSPALLVRALLAVFYTEWPSSLRFESFSFLVTVKSPSWVFLWLLRIYMGPIWICRRAHVWLCCWVGIDSSWLRLWKEPCENFWTLVSLLNDYEEEQMDFISSESF